MSIDTGLSIFYNAAYPVSGVKQSSQQFRDNFNVIKVAIENIHSAVSANTSVLNLSASISSDNGSVSWSLTYPNNAFILPVGNPSGNASAGMIRYNAANVEYNDGLVWNVLAKSSVRIVTGAGLSGGGTLSGNVSVALSASLNDLTDVALTTLAEGDTIVYSSGQFRNRPVGTIAASTVTFDGGTTVQAAVASSVSQSSAAVSTANTASENASEALTKANAVTASLDDAVSNASDALTSAGQANTTANSAHDLATTANTTASGLQSAITTTSAQALQASTDSATALSRANQARSDVETLTTTVELVQTQSNNTRDLATTADAHATTALNQSNDAKSSVETFTSTVSGIQTQVASINTTIMSLAETTQEALVVIEDFHNYVPPSLTESFSLNIPGDYPDIGYALDDIQKKISTPNAVIDLHLTDGSYALSSAITVPNDIANTIISCNVYQEVSSSISSITDLGSNQYTVVFDLGSTVNFIVGKYVSVAIVGSGNYKPIVGLWPISAVDSGTVSLTVTSMTSVIGASASSATLSCYGAKITGNGFVINGKLGGIKVPVVGSGTGIGVTVGVSGTLSGKTLIANFTNGVVNNGNILGDLIVSKCSNGIVNANAKLVGNIVVSGSGVAVSNTMSDFTITTGTISGNAYGIINARSSRTSIHNNNNIVGNASTAQLVSSLGAQADLLGSTIVVSPPLNTFSSDGAVNYV